MRTISPSRGVVTSSRLLQDPLTKSCEDLLEFLIVVVFSKVFDVDIGELQSLAAQLLLSLFTGFKVSHKAAEEKENSTLSTLFKQNILHLLPGYCVCVRVCVSVLHFSVIEQHPVHGLDGSICCLFSLKVNKAVAF